MKQSSLIGHTIEVFSLFANKPHIPADSIIREYFRDRKYLGSKDRKFIADAYFGTIKNYLRLEALVKDATQVEAVPHEMYVIAYLIANASIAPPAVKESLRELDRKETSLTTLDTLWLIADRHREIKRLSSLPIDERLSTAYSFPKWFVEKLLTEYPNTEVEDILSSLNDEAPTVLRTNTLKVPSREELHKTLEGEGCSVIDSQIAQDALVLEKRTNVFNLKSFKAGAFEIQDEASQLVAPFTQPKRTSKVLDACAGAGGKTLHLSALLENKGEIFATDVDKRKLEELKKRLRRSGAQNVRVVEPERREAVLKDKKNWFDVILLDVPCSGTGTLRRNPSIKWVLTPQMLQEVEEKQQAIIEENNEYLKPGGALVYATCSILKEEGEYQVEAFLQRHPEFVLEEMLRTRPDRQGCDGFFAARLRKTG